MGEVIRVLHVISALDGGGVENMLMNYYKNMNHEKIKFDFVVHSSSVGILEKEFLNYGSKVWHVTPKKENIFKTIQQINKIIKQEKYKIVHIHQDFSSVLPLIIAKKNNIPTRIVHSHSTVTSKKLIGKCFEGISTKVIDHLSTHKYACGIEAAKTLYKDKSNDVILMKNAIDIEQFLYSNQINREYRDILQIETNNVFIHVGRFSYPKNHKFLIEIFAEYIKVSKDWVLLLVGDGELKEEITDLIKLYGLEKNIKLLGVRKDIAKLLSVSNLLLLPSHYEGLPVSIIEAQASGIKCLVSDKVTKEVKITPLVEFIPLLNKDEWVNKLIDFKAYERICEKELIKLNGYDIKQAAKQYQDFIFQNGAENI